MPAEVGSDASAATESPQTGPGELLRNVRNERGLSVEQVADDLHLDQRMIEALEAEQFAEIGAPVFVRGHLKAYARALRMDEATVLDAYRAVQPDGSLEPVLSPRAPGGQRNISPAPWVMGTVAAVLAIALAVYVLRDEPPEQVSADPQPAAPPAAGYRMRRWQSLCRPSRSLRSCQRQLNLSLPPKRLLQLKALSWNSISGRNHGWRYPTSSAASCSVCSGRGCAGN